jgi:drug/metabolite transporter (DMT)-like permease
VKDSTRSYIYAGTAILFWSTIATAFKIALGEMSPTMLLLVASLTSVAVLTIIAIAEGSLGDVMRSSRHNLISSALLALLNPFVYYLVLLEAYSRLPAQVAQPLNMIWPIVLVFLSVPMLKQKIPVRSFISLFISFAGVYLVSSQGSPLAPGRSDLTGVILATGSSIFWALYFILNMRDKRAESIKLLVNFIFASIYLIIYMAITDRFMPLSLKAVAAGIWVGIFEMGLTFYLWLSALKLAHSTDRISNLVFLAPFMSLLFISLILKEHIYLTTLAGLILIIAGIVYQNSRRKAGG